MLEEGNFSRLVHPDKDGKLVYTPDERGNVIPDFSHCGYRGGGLVIPNVSVVITVEPQADGDDTERLQAKIDDLSVREIDSNGFRGALLLKKGDYRVNKTLEVRASGIVLRGEGDSEDGTVLIATSQEKITLIDVAGNGGPRMVRNTRQEMTDDYVPVGKRNFVVEDASDLKVGDPIIVQRPSTAEWIEAIGMNNIQTKKPNVKQWQPGSKNLKFNRVIVAVDGNEITVDAPMGNAFDRKYGGGFIYKYSYEGRIEHVGIENLRGVSEFDGNKKNKGEFIDENHCWNFVVFSQIQNAWAQKVTSVHFACSCVTIGRNAKWVTVQDSQCLDPVSQITGGRRYSFNMQGQLSLVLRCYSRRGRHDYVLGSIVPGPNAFVKCIADMAYADTGPHHRWSVATLFDNVIVNGNAINVQDRQGMGSGHGWAGAQKVFWNCEADSFVVQRPPTAQNYAIGCIGEKKNGVFERDIGYWESHGKKVTPRNLYFKQLEDRLGFTVCSK